MRVKTAPFRSPPSVLDRKFLHRFDPRYTRIFRKGKRKMMSLRVKQTKNVQWRTQRKRPPKFGIIL